jgi:hypothetical protein
MMQYLMYVACAAWAAYQTLAAGIAWCENVVLHALIITAMRYLLFQIWGSVCRLPCISRRHQIIEKGISFEQIDHEANWCVGNRIDLTAGASPKSSWQWATSYII